MHGTNCGIVLLGTLLMSLINSGCCQSPCPEFFRYLRDDVTGEIIGRIEIPRAPKNVALHLRISLSVAIALPTKYVGRLSLENSRSDAVRAVQQGRPLVYRLHFPLRNPIPILTEITFNGQRYCMGPRAMGPIVTTIFLEHTLYPPGVIPLSDSQPSIPEEALNIPQTSPEVDLPPQPVENPMPNPILPVLLPEKKDPVFMEIKPPMRRPQPEIRPTVPTTSIDATFLRPGSNNDRENCGRANPGGVNFLIAHGERTSPGQWPWLAAIFVTKIEYEFQCAGNLITEKHVITAAHCKYDNEIDVPASAFLVSLGRYHLHDWRERGSKNLEVLEFRAHPEYRSRASADADLAVIVLRDRAEFTPRIHPICLWAGSTRLDEVVGRTGHVVGWGRDERGNQHLKEPRMIQIPIVSQEDCLRSNVAFVPSTSNRTFCAGQRDGSGPCNGDSGSGLVIRDPVTGRYHLRGIVSLSLLDKSTMSCDLSSYIVYVDAAKFLDWIKSQTNFS